MTVRRYSRKELLEYVPTPYGTFEDFARWTFACSGATVVEVAGCVPAPGHVTVRLGDIDAVEWVQDHLERLAPIGCTVHVERL